MVTVRSGIVIDREAFSPPVLELLLLAEERRVSDLKLSCEENGGGR